MGGTNRRPAKVAGRLSYQTHDLRFGVVIGLIAILFGDLNVRDINIAHFGVQQAGAMFTG